MEHRCGQRLSMSLPASVHTAGGSGVPVRILNIGCGGVFVAVPSRFILRGLVELQVRLPYADRRLCRWSAFVVHQQAHGVGLMFNELQLGELLPFLAAEQSSRRLANYGQEIGGRERAGDGQAVEHRFEAGTDVDADVVQAVVHAV